LYLRTASPFYTSLPFVFVPPWGAWETDEYDESGEFRVARRPLTYIGHLSPCPHAVARLV